MSGTSTKCAVRRTAAYCARSSCNLANWSRLVRWKRKFHPRPAKSKVYESRIPITAVPRHTRRLQQHSPVPSSPLSTEPLTEPSSRVPPPTHRPQRAPALVYRLQLDLDVRPRQRRPRGGCAAAHLRDEVQRRALRCVVHLAIRRHLFVSVPRVRVGGNTRRHVRVSDRGLLRSLAHNADTFVPLACRALPLPSFKDQAHQHGFIHTGKTAPAAPPWPPPRG